MLRAWCSTCSELELVPPVALDSMRRCTWCAQATPRCYARPHWCVHVHPSYVAVSTRAAAAYTTTHFPSQLLYVQASADSCGESTPWQLAPIGLLYAESAYGLTSELAISDSWIQLNGDAVFWLTAAVIFSNALSFGKQLMLQPSTLEDLLSLANKACVPAASQRRVALTTRSRTYGAAILHLRRAFHRMPNAVQLFVFLGMSQNPIELDRLRKAAPCSTTWTDFPFAADLLLRACATNLLAKVRPAAGPSG